MEVRRRYNPNVSRSTHTARRAWRAALGLALAMAAPGVAQVELIEPELKSTPQQFRGLVTLYGQGCAVRYGTGGLDRAHWVLRRLELLTSYFNKWSEIPVPTAVFVLDRDLWQRAGYTTPYGFPLRIGPNIVLAPAVESTAAFPERAAAESLYQALAQ